MMPQLRLQTLIHCCFWFLFTVGVLPHALMFLGPVIYYNFWNVYSIICQGVAFLVLTAVLILYAVEEKTEAKNAAKLRELQQNAAPPQNVRPQQVPPQNVPPQNVRGCGCFVAQFKKNQKWPEQVLT